MVIDNKFLTNMVNKENELKELKNKVIDYFSKMFFIKNKKFDLEKFEDFEESKGDYFYVKEISGWVFQCQTADDLGGHYSYNVCGFKEETIKNRNDELFLKEEFSVMIFWE